MKKIMAEISIGELLDKITILKIKKIKIKDKDKIKLIDKELKSLNETLKLNVSLDEKVLTLMLRLENVNKKLWDIENQKREYEKIKKFDDKFISLSRDVYKYNDQRAEIKLEINNYLGSNIKEVKSYS
tara:strand:- start:622 stop:1005 length:384 start_codon:yes stop_codon:yes gene_type:complete